MARTELIRVLLFLAVVASVFVLAARTVFRIGLERLGRAQKPTRRGIIWLRRAILGVAVLGVGCVAYGALVEPYWLEVRHVRLVSPKLAAGARPVRIVHLSDLHCEAKTRLENRLPEVVAAQRPDIIVFTGDSLNEPAGLPVFQKCLTRLAAIAPTFVVRGNWDVWFWPDIDLFGGTGARALDGQAVELELGGTHVWVGGLAVDHEDRLASCIDQMPADAFRVLLYHFSDAIPEASERGVDLYCAGHTHGGQVALPFYGALLTLSKFGKQFEAGLYRVGPTWLYVNRGIGMEGGARAPRVRFCARPEVTVIEVVPAS